MFSRMFQKGNFSGENMPRMFQLGKRKFLWTFLPTISHMLVYGIVTSWERLGLQVELMIWDSLKAAISLKIRHFLPFSRFTNFFFLYVLFIFYQLLRLYRIYKSKANMIHKWLLATHNSKNHFKDLVCN